MLLISAYNIVTQLFIYEVLVTQLCLTLRPHGL